MARITTRMCATLPAGISVVRNSRGEAAAISVDDDGRVTIGMMKSGRTTCALARVNIAMMPDDADLADIFGGQGELDWFRDANASPDGAFTGRDAYITVQFNHPPDVCRWIASRLFGRRGTANSDLYINVTPSHVGGPIPQGGGAWVPDFEDYDQAQAQCRFVPGEYLFLEWMMRFGPDVLHGIMAGAWFATPAFTGGTCAGVTGEGVNRMVSVTAHTVPRSVRPTDFADYSAGQWIYLLKQGDSDAEATNRQDAYGAEEAAEVGGTLRACPAKFNDVGPSGMDTIDFDLDSSLDFSRAFEVSEHVGTITELWSGGGRDAAKIDIDGLGSFDWVDIFYHCENAATVTGGQAAFAVGDSVLVLNETGHPHPSAADLVIVGFPDRLKSCGFGVKVASVNGSAGYTKTSGFIRLTQPIAEEVGEKGGYTEDYRVLCVASLDANGVASLDENEFYYPIDPEKPIHVWFRRIPLFEYFTAATVGDWPDVVVKPGPLHGDRFDVESLAEWAEIQAAAWFDDECLVLDRVWGQQLATDLRGVAKSAVETADGKEISAWSVDFTGVKTIRCSDSTVFVPSGCGVASGYSVVRDTERRQLDNWTEFPAWWDLFICPTMTPTGQYHVFEPCDFCYYVSSVPTSFLQEAPGFAVTTDKYGGFPEFQDGTQECISSPPTGHYTGDWDPVQGECDNVVTTGTGNEYYEHIRSFEMVDASEYL